MRFPGGAIARETGQELRLPESLVCGGVLRGVNIGEPVDHKELGYLRHRLSAALTAAGRIGLLSLDTSGCRGLVERMTLLFASIRVVGSISQLVPHRAGRLIDQPLQRLSHQCQMQLRQCKQENKFSLEARLASICAAVKLDDGVFDERVAASRLHTVLTDQLDDCTMSVEARPDGRGRHTVVGRRLSSDEVRQPPYKEHQPPISLTSRPPAGNVRSETRLGGAPSSNHFSILMGSDDEGEGGDDGGNTDDAIEAEMALQRLKESASTLLQACVRAWCARREGQALRSKRETEKAVAIMLNPYAPALDELRRKHEPSGALEAMSQRLDRFVVSRMKECGECLWCGAEWDDGHVGPRHFIAREHFMQGYFPFCVQKCAPVLIAMDGLQTELLAAQNEQLDEETQQTVFEAQQMLDVSRTAVLDGLDTTESSRAWEVGMDGRPACGLTVSLMGAEQAVQTARDAVDMCCAQVENSSAGAPRGTGDLEAGGEELEEEDEVGAELSRNLRKSGNRRQRSKARRKGSKTQRDVKMGK